MHTKKWRKLCNNQTSIERIFSRLENNGDGRLVNHRIRGLNKIIVNCLLGLRVMQARSLREI